MCIRDRNSSGKVIDLNFKPLSNTPLSANKFLTWEPKPPICLLYTSPSPRDVEELKAKGVSTTLIDARFAKPLDEELILKSAKEHELMITVEEGSIGGFGSHVKNLLAERGVFDKGLKFRSLTLPDEFIEQDDPKKMYDKAGLNSSQISKKIADILFQKETIRVMKN